MPGPHLPNNTALSTPAVFFFFSGHEKLRNELHFLRQVLEFHCVFVRVFMPVDVSGEGSAMYVVQTYWYKYISTDAFDIKKDRMETCVSI